MANDTNLCIFTGRLGKDPEIRYTSSGAAVASFSIAVGETYKDKAGERQEVTEWVNVVAWNKLAEIIKEYVVKGTQVLITGKMKTRKWQDKDGRDRWSTEIIADKMQMFGKGSGSGSGSGTTQEHQQEPENYDPDQDIPF